ncbi:hypothetical protein BHF71_02105 [Vulcanibacillus modesticaldus]|uniref:DUF3467 domain-containing protein n=2 Tax=Vulcanibacillus modesticaldus TaxID=337097 RepID=A0A1D2YUV8_9BACI|nr:hypothetical protein BHF71_02105 [Vulcanibacillus modesticaldus]
MKTNSSFDVYSNGIDIALSPFDINFMFFDNSPKIQKFLGQLKMSPEHAKVFSKILQDNIIKYEEMFGEIPVSKEKLDLLNKKDEVEV